MTGQKICAAEHLSPKLHGSTCPQSGVPTAVRCRARQLHGSEVSGLRISFLRAAIFKAHLQSSYNGNIFFSAIEPLNDLSLIKTIQSAENNHPA